MPGGASGGKVIEAAGSELVSLAIVLEHHRARYYGYLFAPCQCMGMCICFGIRISSWVACVLGSTQSVPVIGAQFRGRSAATAHRRIARSSRAAGSRPHGLHPTDRDVSMTAQEGQRLREG